MTRHQEPARIHRPKRSAVGLQPRHEAASVQDSRCLGAAAQLASVHQVLRHGPAFQLQAGGSASRGRPAGTHCSGLPDRLKSGVEALSGVAMDDVRVHYNSAGPAQLHALAYTQGSDIHVAPGQERHLPHEAWHVVQQKQGRVKPMLQMKGVAINDDAGLEREADVMGARASAGIAPGRELDGQPFRQDPAAARAQPTPTQGRILQPARTAPVLQRHEVIQRAKDIATILTFVDQNKDKLGDFTGIHLKRLMYWNDTGHFDKESGGTLNLKTVRKAMGMKMPIETKEVADKDLPDFMQVRMEFAVNLPKELSGGKIWFRKRPENAVMQNRQGWISDNFYWKAAKAKYMIHSILGWNKDKKPVDEPEPHITLRNVETQINIDLDITNPLPKDKERIKAEMEVTRTSFSRGLKGDRKPGEAMKADETSFEFLKGETTKAWLEDLTKAAQSARYPELQPEK